MVLVVVERRGIFLALLTAALGSSCLGALLTALQPETASSEFAVFMGLLTGLAVVLTVAVLRYPNARVPFWVRLLLVAIAVQQGLKVARASIFLAHRYDHAAFLAFAILGAVGVVLAIAHLILYRKPPQPQPHVGPVKVASPEARGREHRDDTVQIKMETKLKST